jgi:hypothetical protein
MTTETKTCSASGCSNMAMSNWHLCFHCDQQRQIAQSKSVAHQSMAQKYPKYYKSVKGLEEVDVYTVHQLFNIQDPSGCIQHASKKLLLSGVRTGGKSAVEDITEARDTLTRWIQLQTTTP